MPLYEYYCRACATRFELLRSMRRSSEPATCPSGHPRAGRVISVFAAVARQDDGTIAEIAGGGGCPSCAGGACACGG